MEYNTEVLLNDNIDILDTNTSDNYLNNNIKLTNEQDEEFIEDINNEVLEPEIIDNNNLENNQVTNSSDVKIKTNEILEPNNNVIDNDNEITKSNDTKVEENNKIENHNNDLENDENFKILS